MCAAFGSQYTVIKLLQSQDEGRPLNTITSTCPAYQRQKRANIAEKHNKAARLPKLG